MSDTVELWRRHLNPAFIKLLGLVGYGRVFVRARDIWLWDDQGRQYLDALAAFGALNLGHNHPRLLHRAKAFLEEETPLLDHVGPSPSQARAAERLARTHAAPLERVVFTTGGAEAVESAIKLARGATGRSGILHCHGAYHGTSLGTLSVMGDDRLRRGLGPLLPGCRAIPFADLGALRSALAGGSVAAFLVEPIPAEAGVLVPPAGYLAEAQALCHKHGALLILDEVQTGIGRTGTPYAYQQEGFVPDLIALAKSLGGGLVPVGAVVTRGELADRAMGTVETFDLCAATFAGHGLGSAVVVECLDVLRDEELPERARARGARLVAGLRRRLADHPLVREVRGRGLLVGIELGPQGKGLLGRLTASVASAASEKLIGHWLALRLLEQGVVCQPAALRWNVLKLEPALTITDDQIDHLTDRIAGILDEQRDVVGLIAEMTRRFGEQALRGWELA